MSCYKSLWLVMGLFYTGTSLATPLIPDPELADEWWLDVLEVPASWKYGTGKGVVVALCDSGYYIGAQDLTDNLDLTRAYDFADLDRPTRVDDGPYIFHGTASAALIAGVRDGRGTQGIAFDATILPLQNFNYDPAIDDQSRSTATKDCINFAASQEDVQILVVQSSSAFGTIESYGTIREAIRVAIDNGKVVIIPAGELGIELEDEATDDTGSIIVGALSRDGQTGYYSNFGTRTSVAAFGEQVRTLVRDDGTIGNFGGTTSATAQVAGTVALMLSANPDLSPRTVRQIIEQTRVTTRENILVGGQLNTLAAVRTAYELSKE